MKHTYVVALLKHLCIVTTLRCALCSAWNGILLDSSVGNTQLILPNQEPHTVGDVDFDLPHNSDAVAVVLPDGNAFFIGGYPIDDIVTKFNPNTNTSTPAPSINTGRYG